MRLIIQHVRHLFKHHITHHTATSCISEVLTSDRFTDGNVSEQSCLFFCSTAKWDIPKGAGWWVEYVRTSVHIHPWCHPCPHSVTIIVVKRFRLDQAAIWPEGKSLLGQWYGPDVGMFSVCLFLSCRFHRLLSNFSTDLVQDVSQVNTCPLVVHHLM